MAKKKITTQIKMRVVLVSLEFALAVLLTDCFVSLSSFVCCVSWCKDLPEFALIIPSIPLISYSMSFCL